MIPVFFGGARNFGVYSQVFSFIVRPAQSQGTTCTEMGFACTMKSATAEENEAPGGDSLSPGIWAWFSWAHVSGFESLASLVCPALKYPASKAKIG